MVCWTSHRGVRYIDKPYRLSIHRHFLKISISIRPFLKILISILISIMLFLKISISISISIRIFLKILISISISIRTFMKISISIWEFQKNLILISISIRKFWVKNPFLLAKSRAFSCFYDEISISVVDISAFFEISMKYWHFFREYQY